MINSASKASPKKKKQMIVNKAVNKLFTNYAKKVIILEIFC